MEITRSGFKVFPKVGGHEASTVAMPNTVHSVIAQDCNSFTESGAKRSTVPSFFADKLKTSIGARQNLDDFQEPLSEPEELESRGRVVE